MDLDRVRVSRPEKGIFRIDYAMRSITDRMDFLLRSDAHHDNAHTDWDMERRHLEEARARGALWLTVRMVSKTARLEYEITEAR